jgi:RHS repeat-associated protein
MGEQAVVGGGAPLALAGGGEHEWLAPDWQGTVGDLVRDPWGAAAATDAVALRLGYRGELEVEGDVWLRNRIYQPASRSFLQPDSLAEVPGTACAANPYHYAANNPVGMADPLGLRPVTDAELQEYRDGMNRNVWQQAGDFVSDNWEYIAAGAMVVAGVGLMFTGVGGPAGVALMAASGGLMTAGGSAAIQKYTTGEVDWGRVAVDGAIGAVTAGAISGAVTLAPRVMASSLFARGAAPALGGRLGGEAEIFYRGMSSAELASVTRTGAVTVRGTENFVTQDLAYVEHLATQSARAGNPQLYENVVRFEMQPGTADALVASGARSQPTVVHEVLEDLPTIVRGDLNVVHVKVELGSVNYGLRPGTQDIFNSRILGFGPL